MRYDVGAKNFLPEAPKRIKKDKKDMNLILHRILWGEDYLSPSPSPQGRGADSPQGRGADTIVIDKSGADIIMIDKSANLNVGQETVKVLPSCDLCYLVVKKNYRQESVEILPPPLWGGVGGEVNRKNIFLLS
jgi:hypothetical protein